MKRIITITGEVGGGSHIIGQRLAERLGYGFYNKKLVMQVAEQTGFDPSFIDDHGKFGTYEDGFSYIFTNLGMRPTAQASPSEVLWNVQQDVILRLAEAGSCVIIGRCADFILRERTDVLNAFIYAPRWKRLERIQKYPIYGEIKDPDKKLKDKDKRRSAKYRQRTGQEWANRENYHVLLDSGALTMDRCVDVLELLAKA